MMTRSILTLAALATVGFAAPAQASTLPTADFRPGSHIGLGYPGVSYDYAVGDTLMGAILVQGGSYPGAARFQPGLRGMQRLYSRENLHVAAVAGVLYDPGAAGGRAFLLPDAGLSFAYTMDWGRPVLLKAALTLAVDQYTDPHAVTPPRDLLQRLTFGPNAMLGAEVQLSEHLALTLGGGTFIGARLSY